MLAKKILLVIFLVLALIPLATASAQGLVPCGNDVNKNNIIDPEEQCTIGYFFSMLGLIYNFLVLNIATPLATLGLIIGGVLFIFSGGNPGLAQWGKDAIRLSIIGLVLALGSWLIIKTILTALGYIWGF